MALTVSKISSHPVMAHFDFDNVLYVNSTSFEKSISTSLHSLTNIIDKKGSCVYVGMNRITSFQILCDFNQKEIFFKTYVQNGKKEETVNFLLLLDTKSIRSYGIKWFGSFECSRGYYSTQI